MAIMHENALLKAEVQKLRKANTSLAKRRRAKKTHLRQGGTLSIGEGQDLLDQKDVNTQLGEETRASSSRATRSRPREWRCGICGNAGHNARTCEIDIETSGESDSD